MIVIAMLVCSWIQGPIEAELEDTLNATLVQKFTVTAMENLETVTPFVIEYFFRDIEDVTAPEVDHPTFHGSFDWHSSVHNHWLLVRCLKTRPHLLDEEVVRKFLDDRFQEDKLKVETEYFLDPYHHDFEHPYGWAWLLKLAAELRTWEDDPDAARWSIALRPLEEQLAALFAKHLFLMTGADRTGMHENSAFAMGLALDYARAVEDTALEAAIVHRAELWFLEDRTYPVHYEPFTPDAFLSPAYCEADLMRRVLDPEAFATWLTAFLPDLNAKPNRPLFTPRKNHGGTPPVGGKEIGLAMSRAWSIEGVALGLPANDPRTDRLLKAASYLRGDVVEHLASGKFTHDHWLPSFAVYLLTDAGLESGD